MSTINPLDKYLRQNRITNAEFGAKIGRHPSFVSRLRHGECLPPLDLAARIEEITKRKVPMRAWVGSATIAGGAGASNSRPDGEGGAA